MNKPHWSYFIQNSPLGIVVLDRQGCVELANSAFEKLFQYDRHELASLDIARMGILGMMEATGLQATDSADLAGNAFHRTVRQRRKQRADS